MPGTPLRANDPERVGAYSLTGRLGEGGQGVVYLGTAPDGRQVAVKLLHAQFSGDLKVRARFAGELASAKRVAPFCTARILDADVEGDTPYLVSEFIDGPSLRQVVDGEGPRSGDALQRLAIGTVTALAAIHQAGVVHRDFKPSNVLLAADGPRVIDFGIARALDATGTLSSTAVGTPSYMSPEQISGHVVGPATDVFAWGCTMVFAAAGAPPFGQDSIPAVMHRILNREPYVGMLTGPLRDIVLACLVKDPNRRPTTQQILLRLLSHEGVALPGAGAAPTTMLQEGAQVAAEGPPSGEWASPGPYPPPGGPFGPGGDMPPPGPYAPAGDTPPTPYGHDTQPGPYRGDTPPYGRGTDAPPPPYGPPAPYGAYGPAGDVGPPPYPSGPAARRRTRPGVAAAIAAGAVVLIAAGAVAAVNLFDDERGRRPNTGPTGRLGGTFRMAMYAPEAIDPSNAVVTSDVFAAENLFTGLTVIKPDGSLAPALATEMKPNADCTQWHFSIKQGTTFSDGRPVDAAAFVRGWNRAARGKGMGYLMTGVQGYSDVVAGKSSTMSGVVAEGTGALRVTLAKADCDFAMRVASPPFAPVPPSAGEPTDTAFDNRPIGNGPFKVGQYTPNQRLTLVRNDAYALARPKLDTVEVTFLSDLEQALTGFENRQYDWVPLEGSTIDSARTRHTSDHKLIQAASTTMTYLAPITDDGPMKSKEARLAVSYALDRKALTTALGQGFTPATSLVPAAVPGADVGGCTACALNAAEARSMAARAGMGPGTKVVFTSSDLATYTQLVTLVQSRLRTVLGWEVELKRLPSSKFYEDISGKNPQGLYRLSWAADYPSAENVLDALLSTDAIQRRKDGSTSGSNYARYSSPAFDAAMNTARATPDQNQRVQRLRAAEKVALDDMAMIPLYSHTLYRVADTKSFIGMDLDYTGFPVLTTTAHT
jgi:ABC-type oligopeptide transport system substrate-binding subunit/predicted Ser/Thr protein kinase